MFENINVENFKCGVNVVFGKNVKITSSNGGRAKQVKIGDNCFIGDNVQIMCDEFSIGDYARIHHGTDFHGKMPCTIGHNFWIGQNSIVDSSGTISIGNNCGVGAFSQLWSHIKYGDILEGCRFNSTKKLEIGNDCWFVGHCIVSPIIAEDKSMAMAGSVITKNMEKNAIYAGVPAKKMIEWGGQFEEISFEVKYNKMVDLYIEFGSPKNIKIVMDRSEIKDDKITYFIIKERSYTKNLSNEEIGFIKFLLPNIKFIPLQQN